MRIDSRHTWTPGGGGQVHVRATTAGRRRTGGIRGVRLWAGTDRGHGDGGWHDSVGTGRQIGGGETGAGWSNCGGGAGRPRDLVRHRRAEGVGPVGRLGRGCSSGPGLVPRSQ
jgi:hypothetical protein